VNYCWSKDATDLCGEITNNNRSRYRREAIEPPDCDQQVEGQIVPLLINDLL